MFQQGDRIGPYTIVRKLGQGGMGAVFLVRHTANQKQFALKIADPDAKAEVHDRFRQELKVTEQLQDEHLVSARETGVHEAGGVRVPYLVVDYLEGETVAETITRLAKEGRVMSVADIVDVSRQIAVGLAKAHASAIIHRDIKPSNVFICRTGATDIVKLIDFGLALIRRETFVAAGTPMLSMPYAAPEQWEHWADVGEAADVYAFGCTMFEMATGEPPFGFGGGLQEAHRSQPVPDLDALRRRRNGSKLPRSLVALVQRMLAKAPAERPSVPQVKEVLDRLAGDDRRDEEASSKLGWLLVLAGALGIAGVGVGLGARSCTPAATRADAGRAVVRDAERSIVVPAVDARSSDASVDAPVDARPRSTGPELVPARTLEANRIAGGSIEPDAATKRAIEAAGMGSLLEPDKKVIGTVKMCLDEAGHFTSVKVLKSTGFPGYDETLRRTILSTWKYKPWLVDGHPTAVCTTVTFVYPQLALPRALCTEVDCVLQKYEPACCAKFKHGGSAASPRLGGDLEQTLNSATIAAGVEAMLPSISTCRDNTSVKGTVKVEIDVAPDGSVTSVVVEESPDADLSRCVLAAIHKVTFPATQQGGSFHYPFVF